jgi:hypothetical protein
MSTQDQVFYDTFLRIGAQRCALWPRRLHWVKGALLPLGATLEAKGRSLGIFSSRATASYHKYTKYFYAWREEHVLAEGLVRVPCEMDHLQLCR